MPHTSPKRFTSVEQRGLHRVQQHPLIGITTAFLNGQLRAQQSRCVLASGRAIYLLRWQGRTLPLTGHEEGPPPRPFLKILRRYGWLLGTLLELAQIAAQDGCSKARHNALKIHLLAKSGCTALHFATQGCSSAVATRTKRPSAPEGQRIYTA